MEEPNNMNPDETDQVISEPGGRQLCKSCAALNEPAVDFAQNAARRLVHIPRSDLSSLFLRRDLFIASLLKIRAA
jgi:hypothetical protein